MVNSTNTKKKKKKIVPGGQTNLLKTILTFFNLFIFFQFIKDFLILFIYLKKKKTLVFI